jgi:hypothetical protein
MEIIPAVEGNKAYVNNAEFIKLTIYNDYTDPGNVSIYTFSSAYQYETIDGQSYTPLGGLLATGVQQRDIRATSADTSVTLSGIDGNNISVVLANKIRGSELEIIRGFYGGDGNVANNYNLTSTAHRFTGIVTSYNLTEDRQDDHDNFTVTLNASSFKNVLENRIAGRKTNKNSWQEFNSADTSMDNVYSISGYAFDFGKPVTAKVVNPSSAAIESQTTNESTSGNNDYGVG